MIPAEELRSPCTDTAGGANAPNPVQFRPRPPLRPELTLLVVDTDTDEALSVTEAPTVSVSWAITKRCSVPSCSLAARASSALPSRMNPTAVLPRPSRARTCAGSDR